MLTILMLICTGLRSSCLEFITQSKKLHPICSTPQDMHFSGHQGEWWDFFKMHNVRLNSLSFRTTTAHLFRESSGEIQKTSSYTHLRVLLSFTFHLMFLIMPCHSASFLKLKLCKWYVFAWLGSKRFSSCNFNTRYHRKNNTLRFVCLGSTAN